MKNRTWLWIVGLVALIMSIYIIMTLVFHKGNERPNVSEFSPYISGYTSGVISKSSSFKVQLSNDFAKTLGAIDERSTDLFSIDPKVSGKTGWIDFRTVQFVPDEPLESDKEFVIEFKLVELDNDLDRKYRVFEYDIKTKPQNFSMEITEIKTIDKQHLAWQQVKGVVRTADTEALENIEKLIYANVNNKDLPVHFQQKATNEFLFIVDSVPRTEKAGQLSLEYSGDAIGVSKSGERNIPIPSVNDFNLIEAKVIQHPEQYVKLQFSDPILENQYLDGLIQIEDVGVLNYVIQDNIIRVYPPERLEGEHSLSINPGIKNCLGHRFEKLTQEFLRFEQILPAVRLTGNGVIMPKSEGNLVLPFEAVNLKAVDVRITKIFENNVMQFLQVNDMSDNNEMRRVGKVIKKKTVALNQTDVTDLSQWNRFTLDLNSLIQTDPGAIYRVDIGFRKAHALFPCDDIDMDAEDLTSTVSTQEEKAFWDGFDSYYYNYNWDDWEKRDDPCSDAYYGFRRAVSRNVFASNMGITAKEGNDGSLLVIVTDLITAEPLKDIHVDIHNYQQQFVNSKQTDKQGVVIFDEIPEDESVSFIVAANGADKAYLKVNHGNTLSVSDFDVSGVDVSDGLKGFIYGERGVWRPGDSIFIGFILEDIENQIPLGHPVIYEVYNSRSQRIDRQVQNLNDWHFHSFVTKTDEDAPTGNYSARISVGGKTFYKNLPIETIKPNRLKIDLQLQNDALFTGKVNPTNIWVNWLHGAPAKELKTTVTLSLYPMKTEFENFESFHFDDITRGFDFNTLNIIDAKTDNEGHIQKDLKLDIGNAAPGKLMAKLTTKAFEKGGNFSISEKQVPFHPFTSYVGMKLPESNRTYGNYLPTGKNHKIDIACVSPEGKQLQASHDLQVELIKVDWSWWYYSYDYSSNYASSEYYNVIKKDKIQAVQGKADWEFKINRNNWGYYILKVTDLNSGHATAQRIYADWPEYAGVGRNQSKSASILQFKAEKERYDINEQVKLTLPGSEGGHAFISIENGSRVLDYFWLETEAGDTEFTFNLTEEMAPNVYVHVSLIQPHEQTVNDRPIRMYGVIPIEVVNKDTKLKPEIIMDDELLAESEIRIEIKEANKQEMTYTIAIVDEGLLDLTNFETPNPWDYFYAREALGVRTWDMFDWVIGAHGEKLERLLSIGGGGSLNKEGAKNANRFTPMVRYLGPFHIKGGKKAVHKIQLPKYIGSVRTMVIAGNREGAYGSAEKTCPVIKPLMVLGTLPRVLGTEEEVTLPVTVFAMKDHVRDVNVEIQSNELFDIVGENKQSVQFSRNGDKTINFKLKTKAATGIGKVDIISSSGNEKSNFSIEIDIRNPNPVMVETLGKTLDAGTNYTYDFNAFGIPGSNNCKLEVYSIPPINLHKRMKYLERYPHSCLEQMVSSAFPHLYLDNLMELTPTQQADIESRINFALKQMRKYQMSNGGLSYWPGGSNVNLWSTNYAGHFLLEAKAQGYEIPEVVLSNWLKYQKNKAMKWTDDGTRSQFIQSYRLYTLALAGKPVLSAMNRLLQAEKLSDDAAWRLAAAYKLSGKQRVAEQLIDGLPVNVNPYSELSFTYGSALRDEAMILETFVLLDRKAEAFEVLRSMSKTLGSDQWLSTQTTAYALLATGMYYDQYGVSDEIKVNYQLNGNTKQSVSTSSAVLSISMADIETSGNVLKLENLTESMLYTRIVQEGIPKAGSENASQNKLAISVNFYDLDGNVIQTNRIEQGTDFVCVVKISHQGFESYFDELALTQIFPSGWEIINSRMYATEFGDNSPSDYQDIRDDRIYTYFGLSKGKTYTYRVMLNASYAGKYYLPAFNVEAMYDKSIHARNKGKWVEVVLPQAN
jgi:uncharacterized protein YfaS (alpha-2-macroglobulin family)